MNGQNIIDEAEAIVGETIDETLALSIINHFKDLVEMEIDYFLVKEDATKTRLSSDTYLTAKALPIDFLRPKEVYLGNAAGNQSDPLIEIPFTQRRRLKDVAERYYIDYQAGNFHITGSYAETYTIYFYYIYQTDAITISTSPVWPAKFHRLLVFLLSKYYRSGVDFDEILIKQAVADNAEATVLYTNFLNLDAQIKLKQINCRTSMERGNFETSGRVNFND